MKFTKSKPSKPWFSTLKYNEEGCLLVDNKPNPDGYIRVSGFPIAERRMVMLHVLRWRMLYGDIENGYELNHKCGNRACCNLDHLELICGSYHATISNIGRKGIVFEKKSDEEVADMYTRVKYKNESINKLCQEYNIKRQTLSSIMNKRARWSVTDKIDQDYTISLLTPPHKPDTMCVN